ncbi:GntR family transcriptional regulator [Brassicibacter mesophilus]|uniref:GntR family transcriptional regulator n=1 Tax=Brassicibacter mesophilus TaxID=745119 RepID=UPI003D1BFCBE
MKKVSKQSALPLYYQLKEILVEMIENEELKPGDPILPELELCKLHDISRMTARKAIMALVNEGLLYREQGKGTFVSNPKEKQQISKLKGFSEEMEEKGLKTSTKLLSFKIKKATKKIKAHLQLTDDNDLIIEIRRLMIIEDEPFSLETVCIPHYMCPDMVKETIEGNSLYKLLSKNYSYVMDYAKQSIEPTILDEYEGSMLMIPKDTMALLFRRKTYLVDGRVIEYTKSIYRSDKYKYEIILTP